MHNLIAPLSRSAWADLDALVLEEVEALDAEARIAPGRPRGFDSDDDFLVRALTYLADHDDPIGLIARLRDGFGPLAPAGEEAGDGGAAEDPQAAQPPPPRETGPAADDGAEGEERRDGEPPQAEAPPPDGKDRQP